MPALVRRHETRDSSQVRVTGAMQRQSFGMKPVAYAKAVVGGGRDQPYRFTVLTDGLVRVEYAADCAFEDRASTFATRRQLAVPDFRVIDEK